VHSRQTLLLIFRTTPVFRPRLCIACEENYEEM
jgi:hypothetical protein